MMHINFTNKNVYRTFGQNGYTEVARTKGLKLCFFRANWWSVACHFSKGLPVWRPRFSDHLMLCGAFL